MLTSFFLIPAIVLFGIFHLVVSDTSDRSVCDFVAATNIQHIVLPDGSIVSGWSCSADHLPLTDPCIGAKSGSNTNPDADFPMWTGVSCDDYGINAINLPGIGLTGSIPSSLADLSALISLDLGFNRIGGTIPRTLGSLTHLTGLKLNNNSLHGWIPETFFCSSTLAMTPADAALGLEVRYVSGMSSLASLLLGGNRLSGELPVSSAATTVSNYFFCYSVLQSLLHLVLADNSLTGKLPNEMGRLMDHLVTLQLQNNWFSGPIPFSMGGHSTAGTRNTLQRLELADNMLTGVIPSSFQLLTSLQVLTLSNNSFEGEVPVEWLCATSNGNLHMLDIRYNQFGGDLPSSVGRCIGLQHLLMPYNHIGHRLPPALGSLVLLKTLQLSHNKFTGQLPTEIGQWRELTELQLQSNQITGNIPSSVGSLRALQLFDVSGNSFLSSTIPPELLHCSALQHLDLSNADLRGPLTAFESAGGAIGEKWRQLTYLNLELNEFSGALPSTIGFLNRLAVLKLNDNELTGTIPVTYGELHRLQELHLDVNELEGALPYTFSNMNNLIQISLSNNLLNGTLPEFFQTFHELEVLDLGNNLFSGTVPRFLSGVSANPQNANINMDHLRAIYINNNRFSGFIPSDICTLDRLEVLVFNDNPNITCYDTCLNKYMSRFEMKMKINVGTAVPCDSYGNPTYLPTVAPSIIPTASPAPTAIMTNGGGNTALTPTATPTLTATNTDDFNNATSVTLSINHSDNQSALSRVMDFIARVLTTWLLDTQLNPVGLLLPVLVVFLKFGNYTTNQKHPTSNDFILYHLFAWFVYYFECLFWCCPPPSNDRTGLAAGGSRHGSSATEITSRRRRAAHYYSRINPSIDNDNTGIDNSGGYSHSSMLNSQSSLGVAESRTGLGAASGVYSSIDSDKNSSVHSDASHILALRAAAEAGAVVDTDGGRSSDSHYDDDSLFSEQDHHHDDIEGGGGHEEQSLLAAESGRLGKHTRGLREGKLRNNSKRSRSRCRSSRSSSSRSGGNSRRSVTDSSSDHPEVNAETSYSAGSILRRIQKSFNNVWFDHSDISHMNGGSRIDGGGGSGSGFRGQALHAAMQDYRQRELRPLPPPVSLPPSVARIFTPQGYTVDDDSSEDDDLPVELLKELNHSAVDYTGEGDGDEEQGLMQRHRNSSSTSNKRADGDPVGLELTSGGGGSGGGGGGLSSVREEVVEDEETEEEDGDREVFPSVSPFGSGTVHNPLVGDGDKNGAQSDSDDDGYRGDGGDGGGASFSSHSYVNKLLASWGATADDGHASGVSKSHRQGNKSSASRSHRHDPTSADTNANANANTNRLYCHDPFAGSDEEEDAKSDVELSSGDREEDDDHHSGIDHNLEEQQQRKGLLRSTQALYTKHRHSLFRSLGMDR